MKKTLLLFAISLFVFSCKEKKESVVSTYETQSIQYKAFKLLEDCADNGTPYGVPDNCSKNWWVTIYKDFQTPGTGKNIIQVKDSSYIKFFSKVIYLDSLKNPFTAGTSDYLLNIDANGKIGVSNYTTLKIPYANVIGAPSIIQDYTNTVNTSGGAGQTVYYLTSNKLSSGTALYTTVDYVAPQVNNSDLNYAFGWSYNATTKALTVTSKAAVGINVSVLGLTLLGAPSVAANGVPVFVLVKGH